MWPDRVSNPEPLTYESGDLPTALRSPAQIHTAIGLLPTTNHATKRTILTTKKEEKKQHRELLY